VQQQTQKVGQAKLEAAAVAVKKKPCKFGDHCNNAQCQDYHTSKMCVHGANCQYIGSCFFYHPNVKVGRNGKSLYSRVAAIIPSAESLNGRKQFKVLNAIESTVAVYDGPTKDDFDNHGVVCCGQIVMTEHGYNSCSKIFVGGVEIPKGKFKKVKTAMDLVRTPLPAHLKEVPSASMTVPVINGEKVYGVAVIPDMVVCDGDLVRSNGGEILYTSPTKSGDSGMGVWNADGKLIGFHRSGGVGNPNGFVPVTKELIAEISGQQPKNA
jgi:hypothetical protein